MGMDRKIEKKKWPLHRILKVSAAGLFVFVITYLLLFKTSGSALNVKSERLTVFTVQKGIFQEYIPVIGNIAPIKTYYLDLSEGGNVEEIFIRAGTQVTKGQPILRLSNTNLLITILNNEAQVSRASNDLRATRLQLEQNRLSLQRQRAESDYYLTRIRRVYERNKVLYEEKLISRQEFEGYQDEYEYQKKQRDLTIESQEKDLAFREQQITHLEASVARMQENLKLVKQKLENLTFRAPISGFLTRLDAEIGQSVREGARLGQIDIIDNFKVEAEIDEHYIDRIEVGKVGTFSFSNETYELIVDKIYPEVRDNKFKIDLNFKEQPGGLKRGLTLHIRLQLSDQVEAVLLARGGFYQTTGGNWAFVVDKSENFATRRDIKLGRQNPQFFEVLEGLEVGEKVVTSSYDNYGNVSRLNFKQ